MTPMTVDNPRVRRFTTCALCGFCKDRGLVACWACFSAHNMRNGNPKAEAVIAEFERHLEECEQ